MLVSSIALKKRKDESGLGAVSTCDGWIAQHHGRVNQRVEMQHAKVQADKADSADQQAKEQHPPKLWEEIHTFKNMLQ